jgi:DNA-binding IscR family transcriptional regulator
MKLSRRGLYALKALLVLAELPPGAVAKIQVISEREKIPQKFLEPILVTLQERADRRASAAPWVATGSRPAADIYLGEIVRLMDGPLARSGDAAELRRLVRRTRRTPGSSACCWMCDAAAQILDATSLRDAPAHAGAGAARVAGGAQLTGRAQFAGRGVVRR